MLLRRLELYFFMLHTLHAQHYSCQLIAINCQLIGDPDQTIFNSKDNDDDADDGDD